MQHVANCGESVEELCKSATFGPHVLGWRFGASECVILERCHPISEGVKVGPQIHWSFHDICLSGQGCVLGRIA